MHRQLFLAAALSGFFFVGQSNADPANVHEGQWEITSQMTIPGMPFQPPPVTRTQCITKKDAVPKPEKDRGDCEISMQKSDGSTLKWHVKCVKNPTNQAEGDGEITYSGDSMEGKATFKIKHPRAPQPVDATQTMKGRRLGDCPPGAK